MHHQRFSSQRMPPILPLAAQSGEGVSQPVKLGFFRSNLTAPPRLFQDI